MLESEESFWNEIREMIEISGLFITDSDAVAEIRSQAAGVATHSCYDGSAH